MGYKRYLDKNGVLVREVYKQVPEEKIVDPKKGQIRQKIENEIFDIEDSIADNSKMISLLASIIRRIWMIIPDENKNLLDEETRETIDYIMDKFSKTTTWADVKWTTEGIGFADRLLERQSKIGEIIKDIYS